MKRCGDSCCCTICKPLHRPLSEWDETRLIDQRDAAEAALSETYLIVTGRQPEWSNRFGYRDAVREIREECAWLIRPTDSAPPPAAESRAGEVHSDFRELMDAAWAINDKLRITPGMEAIFTGSTNDIDRFRDLLHDLEPAYRTAQEPAADSQITASTGD